MDRAVDETLYEMLLGEKDEELRPSPAGWAHISQPHSCFLAGRASRLRYFLVLLLRGLLRLCGRATLEQTPPLLAIG